MVDLMSLREHGGGLPHRRKRREVRAVRRRFMPLRGASPERWKRIDRAFRSGAELPPVSLYRMGGAYFVQDGHHRVSVARFHGAEWIDAEVTNFMAPRPLAAGAPVH